MTAHSDFYVWRIFAAGVSFLLFGIGGLILGYVIFPLVSWVSSSPDLGVRRCRKMVQLAFQGFVWFMKSMGVLTWEVEGREYLETPGQLVVANHPSLIDIVFIIAMIPNACCIVKPALYRNPFTRGPVSRAAYIASDTPQMLVENCVSNLAEGASLVVFPEGTRSVRDQSLRFRRGAAYVQLEARCPVALAVVGSVPHYLAKHEKWYQVPATRPHFKLKFKKGPQGDVEKLYDEPAVDARTLTRRWLDYFEKEVVI